MPVHIIHDQCINRLLLRYWSTLLISTVCAVCAVALKERLEMHELISFRYRSRYNVAWNYVFNHLPES
jgi:hypothetical protein